MSFYGEVTQDEYVQIYWWPECASIQIYQHLTYSQLTRTKWLVGKMVIRDIRVLSVITGTLKVYFIFHYWAVESIFYLSLLRRWKYILSVITGTLKVFFSMSFVISVPWRIQTVQILVRNLWLRSKWPVQCIYFFCVQPLSAFFPSPPQRPLTSDFKGFSIRDFIYYIYFPILILEKEPVFSLEASTLPLGYRGGGPWLGMEPETSHAWSQHSTTRLSRRWCITSSKLQTHLNIQQLKSYNNENFVQYLPSLL